MEKETTKPLRISDTFGLYELKDGFLLIKTQKQMVSMTDEERKQIAEMLTNPYPIQDGE